MAPANTPFTIAYITQWNGRDRLGSLVADCWRCKDADCRANSVSSNGRCISPCAASKCGQLVANNEYKLLVRAVNDDGVGWASNTLTFTTLQAPTSPTRRLSGEGRREFS